MKSESKILKVKVFMQCLAAFSANLSLIVSGMHFGWPSPSLPKLLNNETNIIITRDDGSWLAVMPLLSACIGSIFAGAVVDVVGRKPTILFTNIPYLISWLIIAGGKSISSLYAARFIAGIGDGCVFTAVPIYIGEIAHPKIRGFLGSSLSSSLILGILLINIIGAYCSITLTALISSVFCGLSLLTFIWMPESSYYFLMHGATDEAKKSLQVFYGVQDVDDELIRIDEAIKKQTENTGKFLDLFSGINLKTFGISTIVLAAEQLSGNSSITFYTETIFYEIGGNFSAVTITIMFYSIQFFVTMISCSLVDRLGRRPLIIFSLLGSTLCLFTVGLYFKLKLDLTGNISKFSFVPVGALIGFIISFNLGLQNVPMLLTTELFASNVKAYALCLTDIAHCIIATSVTKMFQILTDAYGMYFPFFVFTACCIVSLITIYFTLPETKGKTLEEIQLNLRVKDVEK